MKQRFTHIAYIDDAGDFGYPAGSELGCLVAFVFTRREEILARRRLRKLVWQWVVRFKFDQRPELHCPSWLRDYDHEDTGLTLQDRHELMEAFLQEARNIEARLIPVVLDKRDNQPSEVEGHVGQIVWHHLFAQTLECHRLEPHHRVEWRIDGSRVPYIQQAAKRTRTANQLNEIICQAPTRYLDSKKEILIQLADMAVYLLYQAINPATSHTQLNLPFDVSAFDHFCQKSILEDAVYVKLPPKQKKTTALKEERP